MKKEDRRGRWWKKLSAKERSQVGQKAVRTRKRNLRLEESLLGIVSKMGLKRAKAALEASA